MKYLILKYKSHFPMCSFLVEYHVKSLDVLVNEHRHTHTYTERISKICGNTYWEKKTHEFQFVALKQTYKSIFFSFWKYLPLYASLCVNTCTYTQFLMFNLVHIHTHPWILDLSGQICIIASFIIILSWGENWRS